MGYGSFARARVFALTRLEVYKTRVKALWQSFEEVMRFLDSW
jgi:hypothetical protein